MNRTQPTNEGTSSLASTLRAHLGEIVAAWARQALELPSARQLSRESLIDHVPHLVEHIAAMADGLARGSSVPPPKELAARHARSRLAAGFEIEEIVREITILRGCVIARLTREKALGAEAARVVPAALDEVIAVSVGEYAVLREARSREAEERFELIARQVSEHAIVMLDLDGRVERWTEGAARVAQWTQKEMIGRELACLYSEEDRRRGYPRALVARARDEGQAEDEGWRVRRDGTRFWAHTHITQLTDQLGAPLGFAEVMRDLTERRRREDWLRLLSQSRLRLLEPLDIEATLRALARLCVERVSDLCAIDVVEEDGSVRAAAVEHRDPEKGERARELCASVAPFGPMRVINEGVRTLVPDLESAMLRAHARDEERSRILPSLGLRALFSVPMRVGARVLGSITLASDRAGAYDELDLEIAEDLAQRAALALDNARLRRSAREAIEHRESVLATVSHDLRNPLNVVTLGAALMAEGDAPGTLGSVRVQATRILRAAQRMEGLIQELLDLASLEAGRLALSRAPEDPSAVVRDSLESARGDVEKGGLTLASCVEEALPPITVDRARLLQVLGILLSNAVAVTPKGGSIALSTARRGADVVFTVRDSGPCIPTDERPHVFDKQRRGGPGSYRDARRGLAMAKGIVEVHGGRMWVDDDAGPGTSFAFSVPCASLEPSGHAPP